MAYRTYFTAILVKNGSREVIYGNDCGKAVEMKAWVPRLLTIAVFVAGISLLLGLVSGNLRLKSHAVNAKRPVAVVPKSVSHDSLLDNLGSLARKALPIPKEPGFPQS